MLVVNNETSRCDATLTQVLYYCGTVLKENSPYQVPVRVHYAALKIKNVLLFL